MEEAFFWVRSKVILVSRSAACPPRRPWSIGRHRSHVFRSRGMEDILDVE